MSWEKVRLGDVCEVLGGYAFKSEDYKTSGIPLLRISNIIDNEISFNDEAIYIESTKLKNLDKFKVVLNDILIALSGATTGKFGVYKLNSEAYLNQRVGLIRATEKMNQKYLLHYFNILKSQIFQIAQGAAQPNISTGQIEELLIPLPPLATQKRIADILDTADALRRKDQELLTIYDQLAQAIFIDMFGDPVKNEKGWEVGNIRDLAFEVKYGTSKPADEKGKIPYLRMNNITYSGEWDLSSLKFIDLEQNEYDKYIVKSGDLVFNRTNSKELVGKTAVFDIDEEMAIAGYLIRLRTNKKASPYYISSYLNSKHGKKTLFGMCKSIVGMANINAQELQNIKILIPPIELQNVFEEKVKFIKENKKMQRLQIDNSTSLFSSLIQQAFNGTLVS